jgi:hypothetical protein
LAVTVVVLGASGLFFAWRWLGGEEFWPTVLIEAGAAALLLVPLGLIEQSIERRLAETRELTEEVRSDVARVQEKLSSRATDNLSSEVLTRIRDERQPDEELFKSIQLHPSFETVASALTKARELHAISQSGVRVRISYSEICLRFAAQETAPDELIVQLEYLDGDVLDTVTWSNGLEAVSFGLLVARCLVKHEAYPGDMVFEFGTVFDSLATTLDLAHSHISGREGETGHLRNLIQYFEPQWAITDYGLECATYGRTYSIEAWRLDDPEWDSHVTRKPWVDRESFLRALDTARALKNRGLLGHGASASAST